MSAWLSATNPALQRQQTDVLALFLHGVSVDFCRAKICDRGSDLKVQGLGVF